MPVRAGGLLLTQWATSLGARVITTVSTPEKASCHAAGAEEVLDYPDDPTESPCGCAKSPTGTASPRSTTGRRLDVRCQPRQPGGARHPGIVRRGKRAGSPVDPQRLNVAGSVYLTRPTISHFLRTPDEFAWRAGELLTPSLTAR